LRVMKRAGAVIGNSSSGIIEAPAMGVPTVNIGPRQDGRLKAASVIDCGTGAGEISAALDKALRPETQRAAETQDLPYGAGGAAQSILGVLKSHPLPSPLRKRFYDGAAG
ncbi:MAG: UDP-N-acetylglucosamine 2-epimerase, partial [Rickettsiales bacterium]